MGILVSLLAALFIQVPSLKLDTPVEYQGNARVMVREVDLHEMEKYCGKSSRPGWVRLGCYNNGEIVVTNACKWPEAKNKDSFAFYFCHEKAHKNGWRH
jgi:ribosomal protein L24E